MRKKTQKKIARRAARDFDQIQKWSIQRRIPASKMTSLGNQENGTMLRYQYKQATGSRGCKLPKTATTGKSTYLYKFDDFDDFRTITPELENKVIIRIYLKTKNKQVYVTFSESHAPGIR